MNLLQRSVYFIIGLSIGCVLVYFIFQYKKVRFPYGPNARTISSIMQKPYRHYTPEVFMKMQFHGIDSVAMANIISNGSVFFSKSQTDTDLPCQQYYLESKLPKDMINGKTCILEIKRCDSVATIVTLELK